jgi:hypothetical protein
MRVIFEGATCDAEVDGYSSFSGVEVTDSLYAFSIPMAVKRPNIRVLWITDFIASAREPDTRLDLEVIKQFGSVHDFPSSQQHNAGLIG